MRVLSFILFLIGAFMVYVWADLNNVDHWDILLVLGIVLMLPPSMVVVRRNRDD